MSVNFVGGWTSAFSVVVLKVAPASVFVDGFDERGGPGGSERSGHGVVGHDFLKVLGDLSDISDSDSREGGVHNQLHDCYLFSDQF